MKKIDKFLILTFVFMVSYLTIGQFIMSDIYSSFFNYLYWWVYPIYLGCMGLSAVVGLRGTIKSYKTQNIVRWGLLLLTIFNVVILIMNLMATISN